MKIGPPDSETAGPPGSMKAGLGSGWMGRVLDLLLPAACAGCGCHIPQPRESPARNRLEGRHPDRICRSCLARLLSPPHPRCSRCDAPRGTGLPGDRLCTECHDWPDIFRSARAAAVLAPPADALVHALKYGGWPELAGALAERMGHVSLPGFQGLGGVPLIPVPTTRGRIRERGYNQADVLARALAERSDGVVVQALARRDGDGSQVALQRGERRANVQGAFMLCEAEIPEIQGRDVVLVDDVLTTGATAVAAAEVLGAGGARSVSVLTFARTLPG